MDPDWCQNEPGDLLKLWQQSGMSFLRLSSIKIALFREKSRRDFSQNRDFSFFPWVISSTFGRKSGTKWIQSGAKISLEVFQSFGTNLDSVFFTFSLKNPRLKISQFQALKQLCFEFEDGAGRLRDNRNGAIVILHRSFLANSPNRAVARLAGPAGCETASALTPTSPGWW